MPTIGYRFTGFEIEDAAGRRFPVSGYAEIAGKTAWRILMLSLDGMPAPCSSCRHKAETFLREKHRQIIETALRRKARQK